MTVRQERLEILRMIRDGVLSPEEGEKLLQALAAGEKKERREEGPLGDMSRGLADVGRGFAGMGRSIAVAVDQAVRGALRRSEAGIDDLVRRSDLDLVPGAELEIENTAVGEGSLSLSGGPGERLQVRAEAEHRIVWEKGKVRLLWPGGDIHVTVPETVTKVSAAVHHGHVRSRGVTAPLDLETLHGHLELREVQSRVEAETLAGNVLLEVLEIDADSEVTTLAGCIEVLLAPSFAGTVEASTLGGEIEIEEGLGKVLQRPVGQVPQTAVVELGDGPVLKIETSGGNIALRRLA